MRNTLNIALPRAPNATTLLVLLATIPAGMLFARAPYLSTGLFFGVLLLATVLIHPLFIIGVMLLLGPIDLSFVTGGFKSLFEAIGGLDMNGIRLIGVAGGLAVTAIAAPQARRVMFGPYGIVYVVFLVYAAGTLFISPSPVDGLRLWLKIAYPLLFFVIIAGIATERQQLDRLMDCALVGATVIVLLSLFYTMSGRYGVYDDGYIRVRGVTLHENPFSFYLLISVYMSFARFATRGQWRYLALCALLGVWMVLTLTRITFLAAAVGMTGIGLYAAFAARNVRILLGAFAVGLLIAVPLAPIVLQRSLGFVPTPVELLNMARSPLALYEAINWQGRELAWPIIFAAALASPWTGLGLGASTTIMRENFPPQVGLVAHNEYLRLGSETGVIGGALFALAIFIWVGGVIKADRESGGAAREFTLPALAGILSWMIISITDNVFDYYAPYTQFIAFLVAASMVASAAHVRSASGVTS